jgi:catalase
VARPKFVSVHFNHLPSQSAAPRNIGQVARDPFKRFFVKRIIWSYTAGALFCLMTPAQQQVLFENTARSIGDAPREIQTRHIGNCRKADPAYGKVVADALGIALSDVPA